MATGDDAIAAGMDVLDPATDLVKDGADEINKTRDYLAQRTSDVTPVAEGGTGATTAPAARTALDVYGKAETYPKTVLDSQFADINAAFANDAVAIASKADAGAVTAALAGKLGTGGGTIAGGVTVTGNILNPGAFAGGSGTIAYIQNSDSRITRGVSARKYKKYIHEYDAADLGHIFPTLVEYQMRSEFGGDGTTYIGYIADDMEGTDAARFVTHRDGEIDGIDFIQLLLAQLAQLNARVLELEQQANDG